MIFMRMVSPGVQYVICGTLSLLEKHVLVALTRESISFCNRLMSSQACLIAVSSFGCNIFHLSSVNCRNAVKHTNAQWRCVYKRERERETHTHTTKRETKKRVTKKRETKRVPKTEWVVNVRRWVYYSFVGVFD